MITHAEQWHKAYFSLIDYKTRKLHIKSYTEKNTKVWNAITKKKKDLKHPMKPEFNSSPGLFMIYYYLGTYKKQISGTSLKLYVFKTKKKTYAFPHFFFP